MYCDARSVTEDETVDTSVCIVGASVSGLTLARELMDLGWRVCLLESGGLKPHDDFQSLACGENVGHRYDSLDRVMVVARWPFTIFMSDCGDESVGPGRQRNSMGAA